MKFKYQETNGEWFELSSKYTSELVQDLKAIQGLDAGKELVNILTEEFKLEISKKNNGAYWKSKKENN